MAKRSRPLGLSRSRKQQKVDHSQDSKVQDNEKSTTPQLSIELEENENADNVTIQLIGLWNTYLESTRDSDALLNGIVNECDTLLSNGDNKTSLVEDDQFLAVFALALSELTIFNSNKIKEYFDDSVDIINLFSGGKQTDLLNLVESKIIFQRIPLEYISKLEQNPNLIELDANLKELLDSGKQKFESMQKLIVNDKSGSKKFINGLIIETISIFDDLLDIVENYGTKKNLDEGIDSEEEDEDNDESNGTTAAISDIKSNHPLYDIRQQLNDYARWLRDEMIVFLEKLVPDTKEYYNISKLIGESFLKESEFFSETYLSMQYGDDKEEGEEGDDNEKMEDSTVEETIKAAQDEGITFVKKAIEYLGKAQDPEDPDTWAQLAEAYIDLGNLQDNESVEQEESYNKAEEILKRANIASHNKYQHILDNLNSDELSKDVENTNL